MAFAFHEGERAVQARAGEAAMALRNASVITDTVIAGARAFIEKQLMVATATRNAEGQLWASLLSGPPGFLRSPEGRAIEIQLGVERRPADDPFWQGLAAGSRAGLLFIELATRRRYRVNGQVEHLDAEMARLGIAEAYPNCPKYIQRRHPRSDASAPAAEPASTRRGHALDAAAMALLAAADTLFMATGAPGGELDASHRGGPPGFIQLLDTRRLRVPDYAGNSMFNTLGNLALDPACGLVVPDFEHGRLLHLSGRASLRWDLPDPQGLSGGTQRFWEFEVDDWLARPAASGLAWEYLDASPFLPKASA
ncbi:pyridoxamine 5'-phosphate oxidase family protein [Paucibacter sediminis]|uniref:Pyridoxamine 5'-phosphate oxidase family protein n=1 Tax=Paucibacter sediminis TaxID=3019553 RepID=A0AA95SS86_9BURK|nr:pyridoxamine 5'-phosphate oxidase family protein [Paucibacter sp. S2-9]WIT14196.1 pyridoxamine 5'-phosphate oxidase family protein [Paucibacter sp. S2-9]